MPSSAAWLDTVTGRDEAGRGMRQRARSVRKTVMRLRTRRVEGMSVCGRSMGSSDRTLNVV